MLTLVAMVARCALAAVLLEAYQLTGAAVLTRRREADVTLGQDLRIAAVCRRIANHSMQSCSTRVRPAMDSSAYFSGFGLGLKP